MHILLADDQPRVRFALRVLLERRSGFDVAGEAVNARELFVHVETIHPDLVLLGWELPGVRPGDELASAPKVGL
jgi:DNA-binding NarL/FixJ family response regulator